MLLLLLPSPSVQGNPGMGVVGSFQFPATLPRDTPRAVQTQAPSLKYNSPHFCPNPSGAPDHSAGLPVCGLALGF